MAKLTGKLTKDQFNTIKKRTTPSYDGKYGTKQIFESPDGGITIYRRTPGSDIKELVQIEMDFGDGWSEFLHGKNWDELADEFPAIQEKLEELKVVAELCKKLK